MPTYYRLLDYEHRGMIVKAISASEQYRFTADKGWVRSGIMLHYFSPESDTYDQYEEISEAAALRQIQSNA